MNALTRFTALALLAASTSASAQPPATWVASWQASPQPVWDASFLFPTLIPAALEGQTFRQTARLSLGGDQLRVRLSNAYGTAPLQIGAASVAGADGQAPLALTFDGRPGTQIAPGQAGLSDPVLLPTHDLQAVQVSVYVPAHTPLRTFHWDGRQTASIGAGDQTLAPQMDPASTTTARLFVTGIEVQAAAGARSVVVIGDSITDGATASLDRDQRWTDHLAERLAPRGVAVVNAGISGGRLLRDGMGESALERFQRDVLDQPGVASAIVLIGINDISWPGTPFAPEPGPAHAGRTAGRLSCVGQARPRTGPAHPRRHPAPVRRRPARHAAG